jgi:hypothetical protein
LLTVFLGPFTFATSSGPGTGSPLAVPIREFVRPYLSLAFLDHGYFFFAPNPGPSHLLRARLEFADGRPDLEITLPDRQRHWPRLLYHRHFMLAEQFHGGFAPPEPPPMIADDPEQLASWQAARDLYELRRQSLINHLQQKYTASRVTLTRVEHALVSPAEFAAGRSPITAAETYLELPESGVTPAPAFQGVRP